MLGVDAENPNGALGLYDGSASTGLRTVGDVPPAAWPERVPPPGRRRSGEQPATVPDELHPGRSRPIVVDAPVAGQDPGPRSSSRPAGRSIRPSRPGQPPGRSTRPQPPANSVSPLKSRPSSARQQADRALGVPGRVEDLEAERAEPDRRRPRPARRPARTAGSRTARTAVAGRRAGRGRAGGPRWRAGVRRQRGVVADVVPVAVGRDDQLERPAALGQLGGDPGQRRDRGVDRDRLARRRRPGRGRWSRRAATTRHQELHRRWTADRRSAGQASSLVFMHSKVWPIILLAVPSISRAPTLASVPRC